MDRQLLARATEGTDAPTPGYLYVDLAKAATSNPAAAQEMAAYLVKRLQNKQNPNIKWKCCKVLAKLCEQVPRNQFRRCLSNNPSGTAAIKEALQYRGVPDALTGDAPNERVRNAAKEALDAVYAETSSSEQMNSGGIGGGGGGGGGNFQGGISSSYAPSPYASNQNQQAGGGQGGGFGGGRRMEGIGSPQNYGQQQQHAQPPNNGNGNFRGAMQEAGGVLVSMMKDPLARNSGAGTQGVPSQGHSGNLPGYGQGPKYGRPPPGSSELMRQTGGQWTMASNRGPGAIHPDGPPQGQHHGGGGGGGGGGMIVGNSNGNNQNQEYYKARDQQGGASLGWASQQGGATGGGGGGSSGGVGGSWGNTASNNNSASVASRSREDPGRPSVTINDNYGHGGSNSGGGGGTAVSDGTYEKNLIVELCPAGGMKAVPPPDKLANFKRAAPSLNPDLICPVLLDCIEDGQPWIIRAKALCVMEVCIQVGNGTDNNPYANFFHACHEEIAPLASHARAAVKEPAQRVLQLLGFDAVADTSGAAPARNTTTAPAPAPAAAPNLLDFDDAPLQGGGGQSPAPPPNQPPPTPPPPPPAETAPSSGGGGGGGGGSMFGGMQVKSKGPDGGTMAAPAVPAPAPTSGNLLDFMGDNAAASAAPTTAATANGTSNDSMFAQLNMQDKKAADSQDAPPVSNGSSGFSFMNQTTPQTNDSTNNNTVAEQQPPPPVPLQQAQSSQSFDPLMNVTPSTSNAAAAQQQNKAMQMSPEQMQAMAYQQMRMQQQMQHMQMTYMQQNQQGGGRPAPGGGAPMPPIYNPTGGAQGSGGGPGGGGGGIMGSNLGGAATSGFSFMDAPAVKKDDKKFDFVKDAMQSANKK